MVAEGLAAEGLQVARDVYDRHVDFGLLYNHIECGEHYFRPTVIWAMLPALQGLVFDKEHGRLKLSPRITPDNHDSPFILPGVWGRLAQKRSTSAATYAVAVDEGQVALRRLEFDLPARLRTGTVGVQAKLGDRAVGISHTVAGAAFVVTLNRGVTVKRGQRLEVRCGRR